MNYQQVGDAWSANKAIGVELEALRSDLYKAWHSKESYYRKKFTQWSRIRVFFKWLEFKLLDVIWGNGESPWKLIRTTAYIVLVLALLDALFFGNWRRASSYVSGLFLAPKLFFGTAVPQSYPGWYLTIILVIRLEPIS
jgi:hypothetical protein